MLWPAGITASPIVVLNVGVLTKSVALAGAVTKPVPLFPVSEYGTASVPVVPARVSVNVNGVVPVSPSSLEADSAVIDSTVRGPAIIGRGCRVEGAYIGPYSSLDDGARVIEAEIEHCIVLRGAHIENLSRRIDASLIGRDARVRGGASKPAAHRLLIGDGCTVEIGE